MREPRIANGLVVEVVRPLILNWMEVHILRRGLSYEHAKDCMLLATIAQEFLLRVRWGKDFRSFGSHTSAVGFVRMSFVVVVFVSVGCASRGHRGHCRFCDRCGRACRGRSCFGGRHDGSAHK